VQVAALGRQQLPGTDVMILKIFSPKIGIFYSKYCKLLQKNMIITLVFNKNANFSLKIVIITTTTRVNVMITNFPSPHKNSRHFS
jgi:hypothetical protein